MRHVWVIGASGLLGSALSGALRTGGDQPFTPAERLAWHDTPRVMAQLAKSVVEFSSLVNAGDTWEVYWAAGIGTFASLAEELDRETVVLAAFLTALEQQPALRAASGAISLASSAGALYAGASNEIINEETAVAPTTPYAHAKLEQEGLVAAFAERQGNVFALTARISTLYGVGQAFGKKQGLLTHIARSIVRNRPVQIYVPFDTIRDYITASDAAVRMVMIVRQHAGEARRVTQVVASEQPTTIAEILATFKRVSRRAPRVVTGVDRNTALYTRQVQFRSLMPSGEHGWPSTSLIVGIGQLLQAERFHFAQAASR